MPRATLSDPCLTPCSASDMGDFDRPLMSSEGLSRVSGQLSVWRYVGLFGYASMLVMNIYMLWHTGFAMINQTAVHKPRSRVGSLMRLETLLPKLSHDYVRWAHMIGYFELLGLAAFAVVISLDLIIVFFPRFMWRDRSPKRLHYRRWHAASELLLEICPRLRTFSAMRLLGPCTPSMLIPEFQCVLANIKDRGMWSEFPTPVRVTLFLASRTVMFLFGMQAFLIKFTYLCRSFLHDAGLNLWGHMDLPATTHLLLFLHQIMGIVVTSVYHRHRVFRFILGGADGIMTEGDWSYVRGWQAALVERTWEACGGNVFAFLAKTVTFSDMDVQRLTMSSATD